MLSAATSPLTPSPRSSTLIKNYDENKTYILVRLSESFSNTIQEYHQHNPNHNNTRNNHHHHSNNNNNSNHHNHHHHHNSNNNNNNNNHSHNNNNNNNNNHHHHSNHHSSSSSSSSTSSSSSSSSSSSTSSVNAASKLNINNNNNNNTSASPTIQFNGSKGSIIFPNGKSYEFSLDSDGTLDIECIKQTNNSWETIGKMACCLQVKGKDDVYNITRQKMAAVEQERRKYCTKFIGDDNKSPDGGSSGNGRAIKRTKIDTSSNATLPTANPTQTNNNHITNNNGSSKKKIAHHANNNTSNTASINNHQNHSHQHNNSTSSLNNISTNNINSNNNNNNNNNNNSSNNNNNNNNHHHHHAISNSNSNSNNNQNHNISNSYTGNSSPTLPAPASKSITNNQQSISNNFNHNNNINGNSSNNSTNHHHHHHTTKNAAASSSVYNGLSEYSDINDLEQLRRYKSDFDRDYDEYITLHDYLHKIEEKFTSLKESLAKTIEGSSQWEFAKDDIFREYEKVKSDIDFHRARSRYAHLHKKLALIKDKIFQFKKGHNDTKAKFKAK